jgi:predicted O-linked N-acetylglucosamine transferase (SPINDLY family)
MPYLSLGLPVGENIRRQVARQASARVLKSVKDMRIHRPQRPPSDRICIGYISAGFRPHPSAQLMGNLYARHDRERFRVYAYALGPSLECAERERVKAGVDLFRDLERYPAEAAAQMIANDGVDILVDLSGLTRWARPEILALRPAPIQVSYMDFIGTQGAPYIDYTLLDREILDTETRQFWDEKIAYLPACSYHCEMPPAAVSCTRADFGLPVSGLVFGALHHPRKLDPECFSVWLDLLEEHPDSTLWLLYEHDIQIENLKRVADDRGIAATRLIFAPMTALPVHQARLALADICLDTFVYNGHTTTIDVLGAGAPLVTLRGEGAVARVAASMLTAHGVPELIADSIDEYKTIVRRLVSDASWHKQIRERIANHADSRLFCPEIRVREIESAFEMMWARHQAGQAPADFDVPEWAPASAARS